MKKIRVAVIGYGRSGRDIHKHLLEQLPEQYALAGFVDQDPQRRAMIRRETGLEAMRDYTELFCRQRSTLSSMRPSRRITPAFQRPSWSRASAC